MRISPIIVAAALLLPGVAVPARAGKITADPNVTSPGRLASEPEDDGKDVLDKDKRLDKKITFSAAAKQVASVVETLSELSGVEMKAGQNEKDWLSRERKMNVFAKDLPLRDLMRSMARVMKYRWRATGGGATPRYRFYVERKAVLDGEAELAKQAERRAARQARQRENLVNGLKKTANLSPAETEALKTESPFLYMLSKLGAASALGQMLTECPQLQAAMLSGEEIVLPAAGLSSRAMQAMSDAYTALRRLEIAMSSSDQRQDVQPPDDATKLVFKIEPASRMAQGPEQDMMMGSIRVENQGSGSADMPMFDPDSDVGKLVGRALKMVLEDGADPRNLEKQLEPELQQVFTKLLKESDRGDTEVSHAEDPELGRKVKLDLKDHKFAELLKEFASVTGYSVVSDSFSSTGIQFGIGSVTGREIEIRKVLDWLTGGGFYNWWRHGSVIEFRDREWCRKQSLLVPQAWLEGWRNILKTKGVLDLDDFAEIAKLSPEQLRENMQGDGFFMQAGLPWRVEHHRDVLGFYAALGPDQVGAAYAEGGLDLRALGPDQWALFAKAAAKWAPIATRDNEAPMRLRIKRQPPSGSGDGPTFYILEVTAGEGEGAESTSWHVDTPRYKEPPKKPEGDQPKPQPTQTLEGKAAGE